MITYQPAGSIESFFKEASAMTNPTPEESQKFFQKHGMELVGPALQIK